MTISDKYHFPKSFLILFLVGSHLQIFNFSTMKKKPIDITLFDGVIVPGETYLLSSEAHSHLDAGPIEDLLVVTTIEDLVTAIEGLDLLIFDRFEYRELLEVKVRVKDRCTLRVWCHDKKRKINRPFYLFLHRIPRVGEIISQVKERASAGEIGDEAGVQTQERKDL